MNNGAVDSAHHSLNGTAFTLNKRIHVDPTAPLAPTYLDYRHAPVEAPLIANGMPRSDEEGPTIRPNNVNDGSPGHRAQLAAAAAAAQESWRPTIRPITPEDGNAPVRKLVVEDSPSASPKTRVPRTGLRLKGRSGTVESLDGNRSATEPRIPDPTFKGLQTRIPSGEMEDTFAQDNVEVSRSGTVYISGRQAREVAMQLDLPEEEEHSENADSPVAFVNASPARPPTAHVAQQPDSVVSYSKSDASVFAPDDRTLSQRVRSMYDLGGAYTSQERPGSSLSHSPRLSNVGESLPASPSKLRVPNGSMRLPRSMSALSLQSTIVREPGEVAGGAEDWTDVISSDVDRFGFIRQKSLRSKHSSALSGSSAGGTSEISNRHRLHTPLEAIDEGQPTQQGRMGSRQSRQLSSMNARTTSVPAQSSRSVRSQRSRLSVFEAYRSPTTRQRHLVAEASSMLPPFSSSNFSLPTSDNLDTPSPTQSKLEASRLAKWSKMAISTSSPSSSTNLGAGNTFTFSPSHPKLISRTWKGIPDRWRATAWSSFLRTSANRSATLSHPSSSDSQLILHYHELQTLDYVDDVQIDLDVPRTIGQHILFLKRYRGGQRLLFRVLHALALYFPSIGYVQGMAAIVATLICYFSEEEAFVVAVRMWLYRGVAWLYTEGFGGLMESLDDFENGWLKLGDGGMVGKKLEALGVPPSVWATKWYLTLFNYTLPFQAQLRAWDVFMLLGDTPPINLSPSLSPASAPEMSQKNHANTGSGTNSAGLKKPNLDVLHAISTALVLGQRERLMKAEFEEAMECLTRAVSVVGMEAEDGMMGVAWGLIREAGRVSGVRR